ncbi:MAG: HAD family phosphatase [Selenomonadaceae bacterium]|nr:HAD family phosphatase [Selenomonadaceae bacterium]
MSIKLFVTDLDGTLLPAGQKVPAANIKAVRDMVNSGVIFTIATGRMYSASVEIAKKLGVDVPIITYNGAFIKTVGGEVFHSAFLAPALIVEIVNFCQVHQWHLQSYSNDNLYYPEHNDFAKGYEKVLKINKGKAIGWDGLRQYTENVPKLLTISSSAEETAERIKVLKAEFGDRINAIRSNAEYTEITRPEVSKAAAVKILAEKWNIDNSEVMVIGDSYNDLPMLKAAGHSVAMGNAPDDVKAVCEFVTDTCDDDGFAKAVYKYVLKNN